MKACLGPFLAAALLCGLTWRATEAAAPNGKRPNILFIFTDDQAPWALGASGHPHAQTPHLDALFHQGAYLKNAFTTTPVCSPSRASLLTSRYGSEVGITDWLNPGKEPQAGLSPGTVTWVERLKQAGYRTGLVGKWHLGLIDEMHPTRFGYDYFMGFRGGGNSPVNPKLEKDGQAQKFDGFTPDILTDHAMEFIRDEDRRPFCLSLHFRAPHARWLPVAEDDWSPFQSLDPMIPNPEYPKLDIPRVKRMTREYLASVHSVDRNVGRLLKLLDQRQLSDNTIVIFSSDHGYNMGHNGIWHKGNGHWVLTDPPPAVKNIPRGQRPNMYDHSIRVPTAVRWPGVVKPGAVIEQTVSNLDWFPTLLDMASAPLPRDVTVRGRSILPLLKGQSVDWDNDFYAEYSTKHQSHTHMRMYRTPQWKLIRDFLNQGRDELYDLTKDPAEANNLIDSKSPDVRKVISQLHEKIVARMRAIGDPVVKGLEAEAAPAEAAAARRPNVVLVFIDDMGWGDFSCFGNTDVTTENIDRMAAEGVRFEQFYVNSPICSPSRTAISTGQYPQRWRITSYLNHRASNKRRGMAQWLDPQAPMLARLLRQAGYATGHFGKWHMGGQRDVGEAPLIADYGFDASLTNFEGLGPRVLPLCDAFDGKPARKHALGSERLGRGPITWEDRSKVTASFTSAALQFIQQAESQGRPFYVNLWPDDVHSPFFPPQARRGDNMKRSLYLGVLDTMDEQLGVLFDYIRSRPSLRRNTLILICSDNGPEPGAGTAGPFRGQKTMLYEGGVRSPLVVWGPGLIESSRAGAVNRTSILAAIDLAPSLLTIAGASAPESVRFDGESLAPVLLGESKSSRSQPLFFRRPPDRDAFYGQEDLPDLAVRDGRWKLLCEYDGSDPQLYDLDADRRETSNLASQHPDVVERLTSLLLGWHHSMPPDKGR